VIDHNRDRNAIYIAPTNALIEQQTESAEGFLKAAGLPHVVKAASAKHVREWPDDRVGKRPGEKLYNILREPATIFPECGGRPLLLVTNPDIFYYAAFFQYGSKDRSNIASEFYTSFATIIFDEFHLYDAKQLVSLLFYLALSKVFGYFGQKRKIILLTATPEPACEAALALLQQAGTTIKSVDGNSVNNNQIPSQTSVNLEVRKYPEKERLISEITTQAIAWLESDPDRYGVVILDSKDTLNRIADRLRQKGYERYFGRITGDTPKQDRHAAAQKQVILATSTVDVGFNFERDVETERQNLDWLIFSCRDRFAFWQRVGRVGRVLGKTMTNIPSEAIAYLPEDAWDQGIADLPEDAGRLQLQAKLESLDCLKKPFLDIYWRSEAFLEIARPLLEL
jgi:CRISPR-associated endonuclease/helicase Cas3